MIETFDVDGLPQLFPTIALHQAGKDGFQGHAMQRIVGLGIAHARIKVKSSGRLQKRVVLRQLLCVPDSEFMLDGFLRDLILR